MAIDLIRAGGGRISVVVGLLTLLSIGLMCNWWSLTAENFDLLKQIADLSDHLKSSSNQLYQCRHDGTSLETKLRNIEKESHKLARNIASLREMNDRLENDKIAADKKFSGASDSLKLCQTELESLKKVDVSKDNVIASMQIEKVDLNSEIQDLKDLITKLQSQLTQVKLVPTALPAPSGILKKSTTVASPSKPEDVGAPFNEPRNLPEPGHAEKDDHPADKDEPQLADDKVGVDPRELEMQDAVDERRDV